MDTVGVLEKLILFNTNFAYVCKQKWNNQSIVLHWNLDDINKPFWFVV